MALANEEIKSDEIDSDEQLVNDLERMAKDATNYNSEFMSVNEDLFARFTGELYGDEDPDRSKVLSNDVEEVVMSYMVSMARLFLSAGDIVEFEANNPEDEDDVEEARLKTLYADYHIRRQDTSYQTLYSALFEIVLMKFGCVKYYMEDKEEMIEETFEAVSMQEVAIFEESLQDENVTNIEIEIDEDDDLNGQDPVEVKFKVTRVVPRFRIDPVPPESFVISKNAKTKDEAPLVGDDTPMTRGELVKMGKASGDWGKEEVALIPTWSGDENKNSSLDDQRDREQGSDTRPWTAPTWASEQVMMKTRYALIDYDGDGIAERRYIFYGDSSQVVLINEVFQHVPYAIASSIIMPNRVIGRSVGEQALPYNEQNTVIMRGMFDNIYAVNAPRIAHNENVNQDDLYDMEHGAAIRINGKNPVGQDIFPVEIPYIGDKTLQVLQFNFQRRANQTGAILPNQGLADDAFEKETATRFNGIEREGQGKVELVARNIAETFFRDLYSGAIWMVSHFQNTSQEFRVLGEQLKVDPNKWKYRHELDVKVGLGSGDEDREAETMSAILNLQRTFKTEGSMLVDDSKIFKTADSLLKGMGISNTAQFFNDPEKPQKLVQRENELLRQENDVLKLQSQENPLAEAQLIETQGRLKVEQDKVVVATRKQEFEEIKFLMDNNQKVEQSKLDAFFEAAGLEFDYTKLEVENQVDILGKGADEGR